MITKQEMLAEANKLEKSLKKLSGVKRKKAQMRMHNLRWRAKQKSNGTEKKSGRKSKPAPVDSAQGFLPNFIDQLPMATIEEQVADQIFQALARGVAKRLSDRFGVVVAIPEKKEQAS